MGAIQQPITGLALALVFTAAVAQTDRPTRPTSLPNSSNSSATGAVKGRVVLPDGGYVSEPIKVSLLTLRGAQTFVYTDLQGAFEIKGVEPGEYTLEVEADRQPRFETTTERVLV